MRHTGFWLAVLALAPLAAGAAEEGQPITSDAEWTPTEAYVAALEPQLVLPQGAAPLATYARYYAGTTSFGRRAIEAYLVVPYSDETDQSLTLPGRKIVRHRDQKFIEDGGCGVVTIIHVTIGNCEMMDGVSRWWGGRMLW